MKQTILIPLQITQSTLLLPIDDCLQENKIELIDINNEVILAFNAKLTTSKPHYYTPIDVTKYIGQQITIKVHDTLLQDTLAQNITQDKSYNYLHNEEHRPIYHFSSPFGWINDPNGLFYDKGKFHLYFQYNPYGVKWGNMSWGHASSSNLIHWKNHQTALLPNELGDIFSGSIVIDKQNTAGFGENAICAFYTSATDKQVQSLAYSTDNGMTFTNYEHNPILVDENYKDFRDPKLFWHQETNKWIMSLATGQTITFYESTNLKKWSRLSEFGQGIGNHDGVWECPDLFQVANNKDSKWVLFVSINPGGPNGGNATQYFIGEFDGITFTPDDIPYPLWIDYGRDNYAGVTWHNNPRKKPKYIGWMSNWDYANDIPTKHFKNAMTLPRTIELANNGKHFYLKNYPVKEVKELRVEKVDISTQLLQKSLNINNFLEDNNGAYEILIDFAIVENSTSKVVLTLSNHESEKLTFSLNLHKETLTVDRSESGNISFSDKFANTKIIAPLVKEQKYQLKLFIDKASAELFVNKGKLAITNTIFPSEPYNNIHLEVEKGAIDITKFNIYNLEN